MRGAGEGAPGDAATVVGGSRGGLLLRLLRPPNVQGADEAGFGNTRPVGPSRRGGERERAGEAGPLRGHLGGRL